MKKVITTLLLSLFAPGLALAAFDDAQLTTGTTFVMSVGGSNLEFTITSGNLETVTVDTSSVTLVLATGGSGINITSANSKTFSYGVPGTMTSEFTCNVGSSVLSFGGSGTVTVTPNTATCTTSSGGGSGSGGGGSSSSSAPSTPSPTPTSSPAPVAPAAPAPVASVAQIVAPIVAQPSPIAKLVSPVFNKDLAVGSRGDDVKRLQELLAQDKDVYPNGQATGYFGNLTREAIRKFQLKHGVIKKATDPGNGRLGPKTRAKLKAVYENVAPAPVSTPIPAITPVASAVNSTKSMQDQLDALLKTLKELQAKAKKP